MIRFRNIWFFINLIVGLYFVNLGLKFIQISLPENLSNWIMVIGGALVIIGGLMSRTRKKTSNNGSHRR